MAVRLKRAPGAPSRSRFTFLRVSTVAFITVVVAGLAWLQLPTYGRLSVDASLLAAPEPALKILQPAEVAVLSDGNLHLIEGIAELPPAVESTPGAQVELAFDGDERWVPVEWRPLEAGHWRFLWESPAPGSHRIRARLRTADGVVAAQHSTTVEVRSGSTLPLTIAHTYEAPGSYRKGQLHVHSTQSFDGWESLPPSNLALKYKQRGYQFIVITDHDVVSHPTEVEDDTFLAIPGFESTSESGHITGAFVERVVSPNEAPQLRLDRIKEAGGLAILNHPSYRVGWNGKDLRTLHDYFALELYNGITSSELKAEKVTRLWHEILNAQGGPPKVWAVAVDDAHSMGQMDRGWVMVKTAQLTDAAVRDALARGAFYASNGPSFSVLGVLRGEIVARSPDAEVVRFIDQDQRVVLEGPGRGASYRPTAADRWIRVEAVTRDGHRAWSQPFWLLPQ